MPGMVLSDNGAHISGSPNLVNCLTGCGGVNGTGSTWALSASLGTIASEAMTATPVGGAPWPSYNIQVAGTTFVSGFGTQLVQAGTFTISVNGTVVCQDSQTFAYNNQGGNCTGAGIASSFVNYMTGDYDIAFSSPPANNAVITAAWTNIISPDGTATAFNRPQGFDYFGNGSSTSGPVSSLFAKAPGGVSGHVFAGSDQDAGTIDDNGYQTGAVGYTQMVSWLYDTKFPSLIPGASASTPFISAYYWRGEGSVYLIPSLAGIPVGRFLFDFSVGTRRSDEVDLLGNDFGRRPHAWRIARNWPNVGGRNRWLQPARGDVRRDAWSLHHEPRQRDLGSGWIDL